MPTNPSLKQSTPIWCKIGLLSFGGPAAQIALMHREIVENKNQNIISKKKSST